MKWNWMSFYWVVMWFALGFGVPEAFWLWKDPANTLSYQVWHLEGIGLKGQGWNPLQWSFGHYLFACLMIWLTGHFVDGLWR